MKRRVRRPARRAGHWAGTLGRRLGVLPHRPERWTPERWTSGYSSGRFDYFDRVHELARYSIVGGYIGWFAATRPGRPLSVLDIGCGTGLLRERIEGVPLSTYLGVDLSDAAIQDALARPHQDSRYVVGDVLTLDLQRFDVVVLSEVLYVMPDAQAVLDRIREVLEPDGLLLVSMWRHPGERSLWRRVDRAFALVDRVEARNRANAINPRGWLVGCYGASGVRAASG